jgi:hypothetical protein
VVDFGFKPGSDKPKTIKLVFFCFSAKHVALRRKNGMLFQ